MKHDLRDDVVDDAMGDPLAVRSTAGALGVVGAGAALIGLMIFAALAVGCGSARRGEPLAGPLELASAEHDGRLTFMRQCHACHPGGEGGLGPSLNDKPLPGFLVKLQVRQGFGVMPGFSEEQLSDQRLDDLVAYMQALRDHGSS